MSLCCSRDACVALVYRRAKRRRRRRSYGFRPAPAPSACIHRPATRFLSNARSDTRIEPRGSIAEPRGPTIQRRFFCPPPRAQPVQRRFRMNDPALGVRARRWTGDLALKSPILCGHRYPHCTRRLSLEAQSLSLALRRRAARLRAWEKTQTLRKMRPPFANSAARAGKVSARRTMHGGPGENARAREKAPRRGAQRESRGESARHGGNAAKRRRMA